jgi:small subunit ribosomal protein S17
MRESTRQTRIGTVISNKMEKTVVVQTETQKQHPLYKKYIRRRKTFKAHDETNDCNAGDRVKIMETRPISKDKRWRVIEVLERGFVATGEVIDPTEFFRKKKKNRDEKRAAMAAAEAEAALRQADEDDIEDDEDLELEENELAPAQAQAQAPEEPASDDAAPEAANETTADEQAGDDDDSEGNQA